MGRVLHSYLHVPGAECRSRRRRNVLDLLGHLSGGIYLHHNPLPRDSRKTTREDREEIGNPRSPLTEKPQAQNEKIDKKFTPAPVSSGSVSRGTARRGCNRRPNGCK